jgi:hypothetical protein
MATRSGRSHSSEASDSATDGSAAITAAQAAPADVARQQLVAATQSMATLFRNLERFQLAQQHFSQRAALLHSQAADNLRKATTPMELVSIQGTLFMYQWQEGARYLQELMVAGSSLGRDGAEPASEGTMGSPASAAQAATNAAMNAAAPMMQAWQQMFTSPQESDRPH